MDDSIKPLVESRVDPDGRVFWIDYRPLPASWDDPRSNLNEALPDGVHSHVTPDGRPFFLDGRPRLSWTKPREYGDDIREEDPQSKTTTPSLTASANMRERIDTGSTKVPSALESRRRTGSPDSQLHAELQLLMELTRWRLAHLLSGYPDSRVTDVDAMITILRTRINAFPDINDLRPLESWFINGVHKVISSQPNMNFLQPTQSGKMDISSAKVPIYIRLAQSRLLVLFAFDLLQWVSSKRWVEQQQAMDGFLKDLVAEWNLMILLSTLILSASVAFLSVENLGATTEATILISLVFSLASITVDVAFVWRYQRQLTNNFDMQAVMDEFIFKADLDILAMFLSLPVAFLLWSVILFAISVLAYAWNRLPKTYGAIGVTGALGLVTIVTAGLSALHRWKWLIRYKKGNKEDGNMPEKIPFGVGYGMKRGGRRFQDSQRINLDDVSPGSPKRALNDDGAPASTDGEAASVLGEKKRSQVECEGPLRLLDAAETA
ncbi:hypothetical protein FRB97_003760 [Tulasnella sp. 331]|nr:hypothetical protein FRB97_003760 [Tulasnella sp. 331]